VIARFQNILNKNNRKEKLKKMFSFLLSVLLIAVGVLMLFEPLHLLF
jgi:predicted nucleic acid-binding Zn ribbon protein